MGGSSEDGVPFIMASGCGRSNRCFGDAAGSIAYIFNSVGIPSFRFDVSPDYAKACICIIAPPLPHLPNPIPTSGAPFHASATHPPSEMQKPLVNYCEMYFVFRKSYTGLERRIFINEDI